MKIVRRLVLVACAAALVLALAAAVAGASMSVTVSPADNFRATSEGMLTFEGGGLARVRCRVTLSGYLFPATDKVTTVPNGVISEITEARSSECTESLGGASEIRMLLEARAPLNLVYTSFSGTLPTITAVLATMQRAMVQVRALGVTCLYEGDIGVSFPIASGEVRRGTILGERAVRLRTGGELCPASGTVRGTLNITPAQRLALAAVVAPPGFLNPLPAPMRFEVRERELPLALRNDGARTAIVTAATVIGEEAKMRLDIDESCNEVRPRRSCVVYVTVIAEARMRPARGRIRVDYTSKGGQRFFTEVAYDAA